MSSAVYIFNKSYFYGKNGLMVDTSHLKTPVILHKGLMNQLKDVWNDRVFYTKNHSIKFIVSLKHNNLKFIQTYGDKDEFPDGDYGIIIINENLKNIKEDLASFNSRNKTENIISVKSSFKVF